MSEAQDRDRAIFEQFKELYSQARSEERTGDASLDVLLRTLKPAFSHFVEALAVPHWFNDELVTELARDGLTLPQSGFLADVLELPFVRPHPRGFAYHDVVREALRRSMARKDPDQLRRLARRLAEIFAHQGRRDATEEIDWERVYHTFAYDETAGFEAFDALFMQARRNRRLTVCDTLLHMAAEQRALLSPEGGAKISYCRGLLAFDLHRWDEAETIFQGLRVEELPSPLRGRMQLYRGLILEARGMWQQAKRVYEDSLTSAVDMQGSIELPARFHQRLAETCLFLGDLKKAEKHVLASLTLNQERGDQYGQARNFQTLGGIYGKLRDLPRAQEAFEKSLALFDRSGWQFEKANIYSDLGALYSSLGRWEDAERYYRQAQQVKVTAGDNYGLAFVYSNLGQLSLRSGDTQAALRYFYTSLDVFQQFKDRLNAAKIRRNIALTHERLDDLAAALDEMRRAEQELPRETLLSGPYQDEIRRLEKLLQRGNGPLWKKTIAVIGIAALVIVFLLFWALHVYFSP